MISTSLKFIFLHVPKTAGNAVQSYLLPFSDDTKSVGANQDGIERFGLTGPITPFKHATLTDYHQRLSGGLDDYKIIVGVRDPLDRVLSMYFSPHRERNLGSIDFDDAQFDGLLTRMAGIVDYLRVAGEIRSPDFILNFETLAADIGKVADYFDLPPPDLPTLNASAAPDDLREKLRTDPDVVAKVVRRYREDYEYFGLKMP